jgi:Cu(I)/Ag(I) efflux system membrane fusion protein
MNRRSYIFFAIALVVVLGAAAAFNSFRSQGQNTAQSAKTILYYQCPMHPGFKSDRPGIAPCCGMEMEPVYAGSQTAGTEAQAALPPGAVKISTEKQQAIGVRVGVVAKSTSERTLRLLGRVAPDETRLYKMKAAADGWVQEVYPVTTGSFVKKGQPLASFYTPDFFVTGQNYIAALFNLDRKYPNTEKTVQTFEDILLGYGADEAQIEEIKETRQVSRSILLRAPATGFVLLREAFEGLRFQKGDELFRIADLERVWIYADLYENEARYIRAGATADLIHPQMGQHFTARVSDVLPQFDGSTRTLKVRLEVNNPRYTLRPDMFVDVSFPLHVPPSLTVPAEAVLDSGIRKMVFVDLGDGVLEPRRVETGWRMNDRIEILKGLMEGEKIVVSGNFLIDSESRLQGLASGYNVSAEIDPVCGMSVDPEKPGTLTSAIQGKTYYFCSASCKQKFDSDPQRYLPKEQALQPAPVVARTAAPSRDHVVVDPVCGRTVDPKTTMLMSVLNGRTYYFCSETCKAAFDRVKGAQSIAPAEPITKPPTDGMTVDPVCGMSVDSTKPGAFKSVLEGKTYYFCSESCKETFDKDPRAYLPKM